MNEKIFDLINEANIFLSPIKITGLSLEDCRWHEGYVIDHAFIMIFDRIINPDETQALEQKEV